MPQQQESLLDNLIHMHWGASVVLSLFAYVGLAVVLPQYCAGDSCGLVLRPLVPVLSTMAPFIALALLIPAPLICVASPERASAAGSPAQLGVDSVIALEGLRETPRRVLPATGFQGGRKPARRRGRRGRPPAQGQGWLARCPMQTVAVAAGRRPDCEGAIGRHGRPRCIWRQHRHVWNFHQRSRAIRRTQRHGACRWGAAGRHDHGSPPGKGGESLSARYCRGRRRHAMSPLRLTACAEDSPARA